MFAFAVLGLVFQYKANRLVEKNVSEIGEMTYFLSHGT